MQHLEDRTYITVILVILLVTLWGCVSSSSVREDRIDEILIDGNVFIKKGSYERAEMVFLDALQELPASPRILYNLGVVYALQGDFSHSLTTFQSLNELTSMANVKYLKALAGAAVAGTSFEIAIDAWQQVVKLDPLDSETRLKLIQLLIDVENYEEAYTQARTAYSLDQYSKQLFKHLSFLEVERGLGDGVSWELIADTY